MKTITHKFLILTIMIGMGTISNTFSQATSAGAVGPANFNTLTGEYLGYSNGVGPLWFRNFAPTLTENRMIILDGGLGVAGGRIAMGNNLPNAFAPQDRLHLNQTAGQTFMRFTNNLIGTGAGNGFRVGIMPNGTARLMQLQNQAMQFWIFDQNPSIGGVTRRAEFTAGNLLI